MEPTVTDEQTAVERWGDPPWRHKAREDGCWCADGRKPCTRHDGWDDGYEAGVAEERRACAGAVDEMCDDVDDPFMYGTLRAVAAAIRSRGEHR